jgi:hypothetical protein
MPIAMDNLRSAQHRDTLRYAETRSGHYRPKLKKYEVGDFVWVRHRQKTALEVGVKDVVYRVVSVKPSGVLKLQGKCGDTIDIHVQHCAPCHLPGIDPTVDVMLARPSLHKFCEICKLSNHHAQMLLCDACGTGWHTYCIGLSSIPHGYYVCPTCNQSGITTLTVESDRRTKGLLPAMWDSTLPHITMAHFFTQDNQNYPMGGSQLCSHIVILYRDIITMLTAPLHKSPDYRNVLELSDIITVVA